MGLAEWLKSQGYGAIARLSRKSGVSMLTIRRVRDGRLLQNAGVARAISDATDGAVQASLLIDLPPDNRKRLKRSA